MDSLADGCVWPEVGRLATECYCLNDLKAHSVSYQLIVL